MNRSYRSARSSYFPWLDARGHSTRHWRPTEAPPPFFAGFLLPDFGRQAHRRGQCLDPVDSNYHHGTGVQNFAANVRIFTDVGFYSGITSASIPSHPVFQATPNNEHVGLRLDPALVRRWLLEHDHVRHALRLQ